MGYEEVRGEEGEGLSGGEGRRERRVRKEVGRGEGEGLSEGEGRRGRRVRKEGIKRKPEL